MDTEIIVITFAQFCLLGYSFGIRGLQLALEKLWDLKRYGCYYKVQSIAVLLLSLFIVVSWFCVISTNYSFSFAYALIIQLPLILLTLAILLPWEEWKNITNALKVSS